MANHLRPNMSYCAFENTLAAFRQCVDLLAEGRTISSPEERDAAVSLLMEAREILERLPAEGKEESEIRDLVLGSCDFPNAGVPSTDLE